MLYSIGTKSQEDYFLSQPETGMGYQIIDAAKFNSYERKKYIILNSQIAIDFDNDYGNNIRSVLNEGLTNIKMSAQKIIFSTTAIKILSENEFRNLVKEERNGEEKAALENPKTEADGIEEFIRLSAFKDDKRIDRVKNKLRPGSFATTKQDYNYCKQQNINPIIRYALPNEEKIEWAFYIKPKKGDVLQRGKVQPANDKIGGGVEAFFAEGTSDGTFVGETKF